jgi:hypothetical protein
VPYYQIRVEIQVLSEQRFTENQSQDMVFWNNATKYTSVSDDESFVEEVAYVMVTLHRTGA